MMVQRTLMSERAKLAHYGSELESGLADGAKALRRCTVTTAHGGNVKRASESAAQNGGLRGKVEPGAASRSSTATGSLRLSGNLTLADGRVVTGSVLKVGACSF
jgi:hypothetical protein